MTEHFHRPADWLNIAVKLAVTAAALGAVMMMVTRNASAPSTAPAAPSTGVESSASTSAVTVPTTTGASTSTSAVSTTAATTAAPTTTAPTTAPPRTTPSSTTLLPSPKRMPSTTTGESPSGPPVPVATLPDGSAVPVLAVFDTDRISLDGQVRSEAAKDLLESLVLANSRNPNATVVNRLTVNPSVPAGVGVRVIELTSSRFAEGKAVVVGPHAAEIDRVATVLTALPDVTMLVIGHADQRGQSDQNYVLSLDRAQAVVDYLVLKGISPTRLSVRAVGEADLLTLNDDDTALALNRRTEFVFYGLLVGA